MSTFVDERLQLGDWFPELIKELKCSDCGILCLTQENLTAPCPWLIFEAGALRIAKEHSFVVSLLFGVKRSGFPQSKTLEPLDNFQAAEFTESGMKKLIIRLNELGKRLSEEPGFSQEDFDGIFKNQYPSLRSEILSILLPEELSTIFKEELAYKDGLLRILQKNLPAPDESWKEG